MKHHTAAQIAPQSAPRVSHFRIAAIPAILLLFPLLALAQSAGTINGTVTDTSGAVVAAAAITLTNTDTSVARASVSNTTGNYVFVDVAPGPYKIEAAKEGFSAVTQNNVTIYVNQTATLDFKLTVGSTQQTIEINAQSAAIESSTSELGTVISTRALNDLPLNGRNFTQLLALTPGASPVSVAQNAGGGGGFAGNAIGAFTFPAINGQRNRSNMFLLDGVNDLGSFIGNYNFEPIVDTMQEFKVQSHNDLAEFGQAVGGIVNVVTKPGTNDFHGSLWEFLRNEKLDARNFFVANRNPLRENQFGVAGGGPILIPKLYNGRNKTFFFFGYEGFRQSQQAQSLLLTPTADQLGGNFSAVSNQLYNPFSTRPDPANPGSFIRDPFAGNIIPQSLLNPAALLYATTLFPKGTSNIGAGGTNAVDNTPSLTNQDSFQGRMDQTFSEHDALFGRISQYNQNDSNSGGFPGVVNATSIVGWNFAAHETHTFGPTAILDMHLGRNWGDDLTGKAFPGAPANFATQLEQAGFATNFIGNFQGGQGPFVPLIGISGYAGLGGNNIQDTRTAQIWEFGADFTKVHNRHTLKFGGNFATNNTISPIYGADIGFSSAQTSNLESPGGTGNALASFLLGVPDNSGKRNVLETEHGGWVDGVYVQDQWKVTDRLTVNLGIRWDVTLWPIYGDPGKPDSFVGALNLNNGTYILANVPPACSSTVGEPCIPGGTLPANVVVTTHKNHSIYNNDYGNFQGRAGFAYRLTDRTAIRGGYGRFYDNWNSVIQLAQNYEGTWPRVGQLLANNLNHQTPTVGIGDPFGLGSSGVVFPGPTPFTQVQWYIDPTSYKMPYSDQWNFGIDQQLGKSTVLSVAYVGSHDLRLNLGGYKNTAQTPGPGDATVVASRRPYPYITPTFYDQSIGQSKYNAFQFRLEEKSNHGLTYLISYTYSKSMDVACSGSFGAEGCEVQNAYNLNADRSVSGFDLTHVFTASWVYEVPFGKGKRFSSGSRMVNYALGNWQANGITTFTSGVPFDVTVSGDIPNTGGTLERANLVGNAYESNKTPNQWLNPAGFATPAPYTFGNLGRNSLRDDWFRNLDFSLFRRFPVTESSAFEFRAESFNLTNTPVFGQPNSNLSNPNFGVVTSQRNSPRQLQFALKFAF